MFCTSFAFEFCWFELSITRIRWWAWSYIVLKYGKYEIWNRLYSSNIFLMITYIYYKQFYLVKTSLINFLYTRYGIPCINQPTRKLIIQINKSATNYIWFQHCVSQHLKLYIYFHNSVNYEAPEYEITYFFLFVFCGMI